MPEKHSSVSEQRRQALNRKRNEQRRRAKRNNVDTLSAVEEMASVWSDVPHLTKSSPRVVVGEPRKINHPENKPKLVRLPLAAGVSSVEKVDVIRNVPKTSESSTLKSSFREQVRTDFKEFKNLFKRSERTARSEGSKTALDRSMRSTESKTARDRSTSKAGGKINHSLFWTWNDTDLNQKSTSRGSRGGHRGQREDRISKFDLVRQTKTVPPKVRPRGAIQYPVERELAVVSRHVRVMTRGVRVLSDAYLWAAAKLQLSYYTELSNVEHMTRVLFSRSDRTLAVMCLELIRIHSGIDDPTEREILSACKDFEVMRTYMTSFELQARDILNACFAIQHYEEWVIFRDSRHVFGTRLITIPLVHTVRWAMADAAWWVTEVALEIAARFLPVISLGLSVVDVVRGLSGLIAQMRTRSLMHKELAGAILAERTNIFVVAGRRLLRPVQVHDYVRELLNSALSEPGQQGASFRDGLRATALGLGLVAGVPVGTGLTLGALGIVGGLTIAASPFLAGLEAYNVATGRELTVRTALRGIRQWSNRSLGGESATPQQPNTQAGSQPVTRYDYDLIANALLIGDIGIDEVILGAVETDRFPASASEAFVNYEKDLPGTIWDRDAW